MNSSDCIGRIGGLAIALGIGAAALIAPAISAAAPEPGASDSSADSAPNRVSARPESRGAVSAGVTIQPGRTTASARVARTGPENVTRRRDDGSPRASVFVPRHAATTPGLSVAEEPSVTAPAVSAAPAQTLTPPPSPSGSTGSASPVQSVTDGPQPAPHVGVALGTASTRISGVITGVVGRIVESLSGGEPFGAGVQSPVDLLMLAFTRKQTQAAATPALVLNGYNVIPSSKLDAVSFYGPNSGGPAIPGVQGTQEFDLVDPDTGEVVGSFTAHVSQNSKSRTEVLQVTEIHSGTVGVDPGNTPPIGSIISVTGQGTIFPKVYSDMPAPNGFVVRNDWITPLGTVRLPVGYHAASLHTDYVWVNTPLDLLNGFTIAPLVPNTEVFTTITGLPPVFTAVQGTQSYGVYDQNNALVGSFAGLVTTTSDFTGISTKMIVVTDTDDQTDIGVGPGQVPPVGTVYNVINFFSPQVYLLYQSAPTPTGDYVSTTLVTRKSTIPLRVGNLDASAPPPLTNLRVQGGRTFAPTASGPVIGGNGLPPRNMITQGYQQFDVLDATGSTVGSFDAFHTREWEGIRLRLRTEEILVAKVTAGTPGIGFGDVPPMGTVYDIQTIGNTGFGQMEVSMPTGDGRVISKRYLVTPFGFFPLPANGDSALNADEVNFYDPFAA